MSRSAQISFSNRIAPSELSDSDRVLEDAARKFRILAAPIRLKIVHCLCHGEQNVAYLLGKIDTTQSNMSQHLNALYLAGMLAKRRDGVKIYYRIADQQIAQLCKAVCIEVENKLLARA